MLSVPFITHCATTCDMYKYICDRQLDVKIPDEMIAKYDSLFHYSADFSWKLIIKYDAYNLYIVKCDNVINDIHEIINNSTLLSMGTIDCNLHRYTRKYISKYLPIKILMYMTEGHWHWSGDLIELLGKLDTDGINGKKCPLSLYTNIIDMVIKNIYGININYGRLLLLMNALCDSGKKYVKDTYPHIYIYYFVYTALILDYNYNYNYNYE